MQEASRRKLKAVSVLVIHSVPESLLVACCIQDGSIVVWGPYARHFRGAADHRGTAARPTTVSFKHLNWVCADQNVIRPTSWMFLGCVTVPFQTPKLELEGSLLRGRPSPNAVPSQVK